MTPRALRLAESVIAQTNRVTPADGLLRRELRDAPRLDPRDARDAARAVFSYFRWLGWLDTNRPRSGQIRRALELADAFARNPEGTPTKELLARTVPDWTWRQIDPSVHWTRALQTEPTLWLRARRECRMRLSEQLGSCRPAPFAALPDALEYSGSADLFRTPEFKHGLFEIQDLTSQAVSIICAPQPNEKWWDACAGEGGKLLHLSDLMRNRGLIWASDRAEWRLEKLQRRTARASVYNYRAKPWDGGAHLPTRTLFDGVLLDAPCSGLGTWQRNPHARWTTAAGDVTELAALQFELLAHAAGAVKPGGRLIYAVCTLTTAETVEVADRFSAHRPGFEPLPFAHPCQPESPPESQAFFWPQDSHGNGMFVAAWRRRPG